MHPHCDREIITVMVEGQLNHCDSMGHAEGLRASELQFMSAGNRCGAQRDQRRR